MDEWLKRGVNAADSNPAAEAANEGATVVADGPTVAEVQSELKVEHVTEVHADVAVTEQDASEWFWSLLEHLGYELW